MNTAAQAQTATRAARDIVNHAADNAVNLDRFNAITAPLRVSSQALKADITIGDQVRVLDAPKARADKLATVVGWTGSHYGYSIAVLSYPGIKRTYLVSIFALYN
jgi:hypothetical protein